MRDKFDTSLKDAMRARDKRRVATLRLIMAAIKDRDIDARGQGREQISDQDILALLQKMVKQREESAKIYAEAHGKNKEFYAFYRSLEAYENTWKENDMMVLDPSSEFFKYFDQSKVTAK